MLLDLLIDIAILLKLFCYNIYFTFELFIKNLFVPNHLLAKSIKGEVALVTGAGKLAISVVHANLNDISNRS